MSRVAPTCANSDCGDEFEQSAEGQQFCDPCMARLCKLCDREVPNGESDRVCLTCVESREVCGRCAEPKPRGEICEQCYPNAAAQNAITREARK